MENERSIEAIRGEAVRLFASVRDVPYKLGLDGNPQKLFSGGNCVRKILYLAPRLNQLGYKTTGLGLAIFDWREFDIPKEIMDKLKDPIDTHTFLYTTNLNGDEIHVDPAWDSGMPDTFKKSNWDGKSSTHIGVTPLSLRRENFDLFKARIVLSITKENMRTIMNLKKVTPFNDAFNAWLERF